MYIEGKVDFKDYKNGGKKVENSEVRSYLSQLFGTSYQKVQQVPVEAAAAGDTAKLKKAQFHSAHMT